MRHVSCLCIRLGHDRRVGHFVDLPTYRAELGRLGANELWQAGVFLGGLCHLARNYGRVYSHTPTTAAKDATIAEDAEGGSDGRFLFGIFVSIYGSIRTR